MVTSDGRCSCSPFGPAIWGSYPALHILKPARRGCWTERWTCCLYCAGDFIDDYAVDEVERNDESFAFVVQTEGQHVNRVRAFPTIIRDFQARRPPGGQAEAIAAK